MPYLHHITIEGFRSIRKLDLDLRDVNVLIGANGAGKSNFLAAFNFLREVRFGRLQEYTRAAAGANRILHFGSKTTSQVSVVVQFGIAPLRHYALDLAVDKRDSFFVRNESGVDGSQIVPTPPSGHEAGISVDEADDQPALLEIRETLADCNVYHFNDTSDTSPMKTSCDVEDNRALRPDGRNVAAMLYRLKQKEPVAYKRVLAAVRQIAPFVQNFVLQPSALDEQKIYLEWQHAKHDGRFDGSYMSDGTLRFICLAVLLLQPDSMRPSLILLDEPEIGLHPAAIALLAEMIQSAASSSQLIVSTQSPLLLDYFAPEDVLVTGRDDEATTVERLSADELGDWLEEYSLGQIWEKNLIGGRP